MNLSPSQREGIRAIAKGETFNKGTVNSLRRKGLVRERFVGHYELTERGKRYHEQIMATGDGPESLKELLRF